MIANRRRLGVGIGRDRVAAALVARDTVLWAASHSREKGATLADSLGVLLAECPRSRFVTPRVNVAVGPSATQVKRVTDLPPLTESRALAGLVREQAARFFLMNGVPLVFSGGRLESPGCLWIAAFEEPDVAQIITACRAARLPLCKIVPTAVALGFVTNGSPVGWTDGPVRVSITYVDQLLTQIRRVPAEDGAANIVPVATSLATLGTQAAGVMDAVGAARLTREEALVLRTRDRNRRAVPSRRRLITAAMACVAGVLLGLLSPGLVAWVVLSRAQAQETAVRPLAMEAEREAHALTTTSTALEAFATFANSRPSMVLFLAQMTRALPDSSALVALQIDSAGTGNVVAVSSHAAAIVDAVERMPTLASPEIVGPVTHESLGGRAIERVTVRFRVLAGTRP